MQENIYAIFLSWQSVEKYTILNEYVLLQYEVNALAASWGSALYVIKAGQHILVQMFACILVLGFSTTSMGLLL